MELHEEDWEFINDDGFVYKRLKRHPVHPAPPPDPAAEERNRKKRKNMALLKLKTRYQQEILNWELLSNTLKALQDRTQTQLSEMVLPDLDVAISTELLLDSADCEIAETLLAQSGGNLFRLKLKKPLATRSQHYVMLLNPFAMLKNGC